MSWIEVFYYSTAKYGFGPVPVDEQLAVLDAHELERFHSFKRPEPQSRFLLTRWIVKTQLSEHTKLTPSEHIFEISKTGKPSLIKHQAMPDLHFSLSHCESAVAVALSNKPVGVDVESNDHRGKPWLDVEKFLNPEAALAVSTARNDAGKQQIFARYWSCMESLVKLRGSSLFTEREAFSLGIPPMLKSGSVCVKGVNFQTRSIEDLEQLSLAYKFQGVEVVTQYYEFDGSEFLTTNYV